MYVTKQWQIFSKNTNKFFSEKLATAFSLPSEFFFSPSCPPLAAFVSLYKKNIQMQMFYSLS